MSATSQFDLLRLSEVAAYLRIGRTTLYQLLKAGEIKRVKVRGCTRVQRREVERYIERCAKKG